MQSSMLFTVRALAGALHNNMNQHCIVSITQQCFGTSPFDIYGRNETRTFTLVFLGAALLILNVFAFASAASLSQAMLTFRVIYD